MENLYESDVFISDLQNHLRKHVLPVKYAYTLSAAKFHTEFANSHNYKSTVKINCEEYGMLIKHLSVDKYDYYEIGGDNGEISINIIKFLCSHGIIFGGFNFIDISKELLKKCKDNFDSSMDDALVNFIQYDIEQKNSTIPISNSNKKILFFIGNTLGNVESENNVLQNIYNSMDKDDLLLIGLTMWNADVDELESYDNDLFRESVLEFLRILGVKTDKKNYSLKYDAERHVVICEYEFNTPFTYGNIHFETGEKIRCFQSKRYNLDSCESLFKSNHFDVIERTIDNKSRHTLFLLKKHEGGNI